MSQVPCMKIAEGKEDSFRDVSLEKGCPRVLDPDPLPPHCLLELRPQPASPHWSWSGLTGSV